MIRALVNGKPGDQISLLDRGVQFGDGLFETIAVANHKPCLWNYHVQRLQSGCERLGIAAPDAQVLEQEALDLIAQQQRAVLKITVTRGISERGYKYASSEAPTRILSLFPWNSPCSETLSIAVSDRRLGHYPDLAGIKHLNRLEQVLARADCPETVQEALMLDQQGHVIEGIMSNLFIQRGQKLFTPSLRYCGVEGVVKRLILEMAKERSMAIETGDFSLEEILRADALYLTNSLTGIRFVSGIAGYDWQPGTGFHSLLEEATEQVFH